MQRVTPVRSVLWLLFVVAMISALRFTRGDVLRDARGQRCLVGPTRGV